MRTIIAVCFGTVLFCVSVVAQPTRPGSTEPQPASASNHTWVLQSSYSDEFNESRLDTNKWDNHPRSWGVWSWRRANAWVHDGCLHLRMQYQENRRDGKKLFYTSGIVISKASPIRYGYFEARIKAAPLYPGVCPAFWAFHNTKDLWTEIDFVELTQNQRNPRLIYTNTHVFRHPKLAPGKRVHESRTWQAPWDPRDGFHTYGCDWEPGQITWYIDGKRVATRKNEYWDQPLDVTLSFGLRPPLTKVPSAKGLPTDFLVDYVRVWKKKPASTQ